MVNILSSYYLFEIFFLKGIFGKEIKVLSFDYKND